MKARAVALTIAVLLGGCSTTTAPGTTSGSAEAPRSAGKDAVAKAALVIDVRTPEEFASGHVGRAENIPVGEVEARVDEIAQKLGGEKSKPVAVYCAAGVRAGPAKAALEKAGFTNVTNAGGYEDLAGD